MRYASDELRYERAAERAMMPYYYTYAIIVTAITRYQPLRCCYAIQRGAPLPYMPILYTLR